MPLGIVSDEIFEQELARSDAGAKHIDIVRGRGSVRETPEVIREIIAEEAIASNKTGEEVAQEFGISTASVSAYKNGATSTASYNEPDKRLQRANDEVRGTIVRSARSRLMQALEHITPEKLKEAKLRDVASVAKDMSTIMTNMEPQISNGAVNAQFIFHVPKARQESEYDIIEVTQ